MPSNIENVNDPQETDDDLRPIDIAGGPVKPKPIGTRKIVLICMLMLAFVSYLVYARMINPPAPPQHDYFEK